MLKLILQFCTVFVNVCIFFARQEKVNFKLSTFWLFRPVFTSLTYFIEWNWLIQASDGCKTFGPLNSNKHRSQSGFKGEERQFLDQAGLDRQFEAPANSTDHSLTTVAAELDPSKYSRAKSAESHKSEPAKFVNKQFCQVRQQFVADAHGANGSPSHSALLFGCPEQQQNPNQITEFSRLGWSHAGASLSSLFSSPA